MFQYNTVFISRLIHSLVERLTWRTRMGVTEIMSRSEMGVTNQCLWVDTAVNLYLLMSLWLSQCMSSSDLTQLINSLDSLHSLAHVSIHSNCTEMKRSEEHTSELQSHVRISYAVFCLKKKKQKTKKKKKEKKHVKNDNSR